MSGRPKFIVRRKGMAQTEYILICAALIISMFGAFKGLATDANNGPFNLRSIAGAVTGNPLNSPSPEF